MPNVINATSTGNGGLITQGDDSGILNIQTNETTAITVDASQNVGIGGAVTNEGGYSRCLQVTGTDGAVLEVKQGSSYSYFAQNGTTLQVRNNATSGAMTFATEATERMRISSAGGVYINCVNNPSASTVGAAFVPGVSTSGLPTWMSSTGTTGNAEHAYFYNPNGLVGFIRTNGSTTTYSTSSDYRLKENIAPMTGALATVAQLKPVTYKWKVDGSDGQGFIAHELQAVVPDCVSGEKDEVDADGNPKHQGIDTSFLVATLTAALQETKALIDTQSETLTQQTEAINALTARIVALEEK